MSEITAGQDHDRAVLQPQWSRPLGAKPIVYASFSSGVAFASPGIVEPLATSGVDFESTFGTPSPTGPITSGVQFGSRFQVIGGDLADARYRR
jgi:hypothetical protein